MQAKYKMLTGCQLGAEGVGGGGGAVAGREACPAKRDVDVALQVVVVGDE